MSGVNGQSLDPNQAAKIMSPESPAIFTMKKKDANPLSSGVLNGIALQTVHPINAVQQSNSTSIVSKTTPLPPAHISLTGDVIEKTQAFLKGLEMSVHDIEGFSQFIGNLSNASTSLGENNEIKITTDSGVELELYFDNDSSKGYIQTNEGKKTLIKNESGKWQLEFPLVDNKEATASPSGAKLLDQNAQANANTIGQKFDESLVSLYQILELFQKMGIEERRAARQGRAASQVGVVKSILNQADLQLSSAYTSGITRIATGAFKVASGAINIAGSVKGLAADKRAIDAAGKNEAPHFTGQMISQKFQGISGMVDGSGEFVGASGGMLSGAQDAAATRERATEEQFRQLKSYNEGWMDTQDAVAKKALDVISQMISQDVSAKQRAAGNI
ncbi:MAG: hypothetical protein HAW67_00495 [Endozoicomonadaceae bacterium]|nr:hypothetical protein [Endozoicomonadaceae bacterium]MBE8232181.1 hypothetical protein [Endozoicomonadaceae bacterium]